MRYIALLTLIFIGNTLCHGQDGINLKTEAATIDDFVPTEWKIIQTTKGDLNKDQIDDVALVIQKTDSKNIELSTIYGADTLDSNPRMLLILFKDTTTGKFKLNDISTSFILSHSSWTMDDPFDGITISKGILNVGYHFWYSTGSWYQTTLEYKFRFQKNEFVLIGAEFDEMHRGTMERTQRSFNFLTKKMSEIKTTYDGEVSDGTAKRVMDWKNLNFKELKTLKSLSQPLQWTVLPNVNI